MLLFLRLERAGILFLGDLSALVLFLFTGISLKNEIECALEYGWICFSALVARVNLNRIQTLVNPLRKQGCHSKFYLCLKMAGDLLVLHRMELVFHAVDIIEVRLEHAAFLFWLIKNILEHHFG